MSDHGPSLEGIPAITEMSLDKVQKLIELAADPRTPEKERAAAALQAVKRIKEENLLGRVTETWSRSTERPPPARPTPSRPAQHSPPTPAGEDYYRIKVPLVFLRTTATSYRLGRIEPRQLYTNRTMYIAHLLIRNIIYLSDAELIEKGWIGWHRPVSKELDMHSSLVQDGKYAQWW